MQAAFKTTNVVDKQLLDSFCAGILVNVMREKNWVVRNVHIEISYFVLTTSGVERPFI